MILHIEVSILLGTYLCKVQGHIDEQNKEQYLAKDELYWVVNNLCGQVRHYHWLRHPDHQLVVRIIAVLLLLLALQLVEVQLNI